MTDETTDAIAVTVEFSADQDPAVCETLGGLAEAERPERVRQWARLGHLVMSMARVAPGKEALREYLGDFTRDAEELREVIRDHLDMFRQKTTRADGDLGERFVREQLFDAFKDEADQLKANKRTTVNLDPTPILKALGGGAHSHGSFGSCG